MSPTVAGFVEFIEQQRWHSFPVSLKEFKELANQYINQHDDTILDSPRCEYPALKALRERNYERINSPRRKQK